MNKTIGNINMDKIIQSISKVQSFLGNMILVILFLIFIYMFVSDFKGICKLAKMVLDIYRSDKKNQIISHIKFLLRTKGDFIDKITTFEYIKTWSQKQVNEIIHKYTIKNEKEEEYGVVKQKKAIFYTDLQKACVESNQQLDTLAFAVALLIATELDVYGDTSYIVVGQADGNILLASKVASILGLRYLIVGNLAGKKKNIFGSYYKSDKAIVVDDILFTGAMLINNLDILYKSGLQCTNIVVVMRRSLAYQETLAKFTNKVGFDISVSSLVTYLDNNFPF